MSKARIFIDSDVVISSLISSTGAAHLLLNKRKSKFIISNISQKELEEVTKRLNLNKGKLASLIKKKLKTVRLAANLEKINKDFKDYILDPNDIHIIAGAVKAKAQFLLSYNIRHFKRQEINKDLGIIVLTPAQYLQYLRSLE